ncbi:hypothetical protein B0H13DRAFT_2533413 [Mycena leptocephala]|nr:hypothetical protein B0H13DRAFT_2533413 [Mycena leptocephala]
MPLKHFAAVAGKMCDERRYQQCFECAALVSATKSCAVCRRAAGELGVGRVAVSILQCAARAREKSRLSGTLKSFADACSRQTGVSVDNSNVFAHGGASTKAPRMQGDDFEDSSCTPTTCACVSRKIWTTFRRTLRMRMGNLVRMWIPSSDYPSVYPKASGVSPYVFTDQGACRLPSDAVLWIHTANEAGVGYALLHNEGGAEARYSTNVLVYISRRSPARKTLRWATLIVPSPLESSDSRRPIPPSSFVWGPTVHSTGISLRTVPHPHCSGFRLDAQCALQVATPSYARHPPPSHARPAYVHVHTRTRLLLPRKKCIYTTATQARPTYRAAPFPVSAHRGTSALVNRERTQQNRAYFLASSPRCTSAQSMASTDAAHARIRALLNASSGFERALVDANLAADPHQS